MENTITRIADLPNETNDRQPTNSFASSIPPTTISVNNTRTSKMDGEIQTNYTPINVHPNPYGVSAQNPIMEHPMQQESLQQNITFEQSQQEALQNLPQQNLPSRDIPQDTTVYSNDERVQPNYIPKPNTNEDYVRDHYKMTEENLREYEMKQRRINYWDDILTNIQIPIFIAILFFLFHLPIVNTFIFKRFSFLSLYNDDGNFNMFGLILKSVMFGSVYFSINNIIKFISEF
tara:strand:+ start:138 stop:836 length:699 start_codon:yes stop_codon:yes gene_type:complete